MFLDLSFCVDFVLKISQFCFWSRDEKMDRYRRVEKPREETPINDNEIRITTQGRMRSYITYATSLLQEKESNEIVFKAMGRAINKTVVIVELIKRRVAGLHQNTAVGSLDITDTWEPLEEGLLPLETTRHVSMISITLSKMELDKLSAGYQSPLPADQVKPSAEYDYEGEVSPAGRGRGRVGHGRGRGRENGPMMVDYGERNWDNRERGFGRGGWGRGRGRGFRGWGRGGGYGGRSNYQQDNAVYIEDATHAPVQGRGRGGGRRQIRQGRGRDARSNGPINAVAGEA